MAHAIQPDRRGFGQRHLDGTEPGSYRLTNMGWRRQASIAVSALMAMFFGASCGPSTETVRTAAVAARDSWSEANMEWEKTRVACSTLAQSIVPERRVLAQAALAEVEKVVSESGKLAQEWDAAVAAVESAGYRMRGEISRAAAEANIRGTQDLESAHAASLGNYLPPEGPERLHALKMPLGTSEEHALKQVAQTTPISAGVARNQLRLVEAALGQR